MAQQVAVIDGAQAKELEQVVLVGLDGVVQLAGVGGHELRHLRADETLVETSCSSSSLWLSPSAEASSVAFNQCSVSFIFSIADRTCSNTGRCCISRTQHAWISLNSSAGQPAGATLNGSDDLVDIDWFEVAVALAHPHGCVGYGRFDVRVVNPLLGECHVLSFPTGSRRFDSSERLVVAVHYFAPGPTTRPPSCNQAPWELVEG